MCVMMKTVKMHQAEPKYLAFERGQEPELIN